MNPTEFREVMPVVTTIAAMLDAVGATVAAVFSALAHRRESAKGRTVIEAEPLWHPRGLPVLPIIVRNLGDETLARCYRSGDSPAPRFENSRRPSRALWSDASVQPSAATASRDKFRGVFDRKNQRRFHTCCVERGGTSSLLSTFARLGRGLDQNSHRGFISGI